MKNKLHTRVLMVCFTWWPWISSSQAQPPKASIPSPTAEAQTGKPTSPPQQASTNKCETLPITKPAQGTATTDELYAALDEFEAAFAQQDAGKFRKLIHPAIQQKTNKKDEAFLSAFNNYGLAKPKLLRNAVFRLNLPNQANLDTQCNEGIIRGVVGPQEQYVALHSDFSGSEQVRFFTIFAPIPQSQADLHKIKAKLGIVLFHVQVWTHSRKSPDKMLEDARSFSALNEPLSAWLYAEGARRIAGANPYFIPSEYKRSVSIVDEMNGRRPSPAQIKERLKSEKLDWDFVDFTTVYQANGLESGVIFRTKKEESVENIMRDCKENTAKVAKLVPELKRHFRGLECLTYQPDEETKFDPSAGSVFLTWKELGL